MSKYRTISCGIDHRRLFETDSKSGVIEIKCMKCKNIVRINLENDEQYFPLNCNNKLDTGYAAST